VAAPGRAGGGGMTIGPLPTTFALAGSGTELDCAWAAPGLGGVALWASASTHVLTSNAAANFNSMFFIVFLT